MTYKVFLFQIPAGYEVDEEVKPRVPDLDCGEEELLTHLLNIYDDDQEEEKVEDADSDDDSEAGPESDEDDDRIEDFIEEGNCAQATTDEAKECPDWKSCFSNLFNAFSNKLTYLSHRRRFI